MKQYRFNILSNKSLAIFSFITFIAQFLFLPNPASATIPKTITENSGNNFTSPFSSGILIITILLLLLVINLFLKLKKLQASLNEKEQIIQKQEEEKDKTKEKTDSLFYLNSEEEFKQVLQMLPVAVAIYSPNNTNLFFNDNFEKTFGYSIDDIKSVDNWFTKAYPDEQYRNKIKKSWEDKIDNYLKTKKKFQTVVAKVTCKDRSIKDIEFNFETIGDKFLTTFVDLTEYKQTEQILIENELRYRNMISIADAVVYEQTLPDYKFTFFSEDIEKMTGYTPKEMTADIWNSLIDECIIIGENADLTKEELSRRIRNGEISQWRADYKIHTKTGETRWLTDSSIHILDKTGKPYKSIGILQDITERKLSSETLQKSEERLRKISDFIGQLIYDWDIRTGTLIWSGKSIQITGYSQEEINSLGIKGWEDAIHPEDRISTFEKLESAMKNHAIFQTEYKFRKADGTYMLVNDQGIFSYNENNQPLRMLGVMMDITAQRKSENDLAQAQAILAAAIEQNPAGILIADAPDAKIRIANSAALGIRGDISQNLINIPVELQPKLWQTYWPDGTPIAPEDLPLSRAIQKGETTSNTELIIKRTNGEPRWVLANAAPVRNRNGEIIAGVAVFPDITERKLAEEELESAHQRFQDIIEFFPYATFVIDQEKKIVAWNKACEDMTGVKKEELIGKGDYAYSLPFWGIKKPILIDLVDMTSEEISNIYKYVKRIGNQVYAEAYIQSLHNGKGAYLWGVAAPLFDRYGKRSGAIEVIRDTTDLKKLEDQLRQSQKMEAVGQLAGGVAHDFNNLLQAILGYINMVLDDLQTDDKHRSDLLEANHAAERAATLTRQLLAFSRRQFLNLQSLDLNETISELMKMLRRLIGENIDLDIIQGHNIYYVNADRTQIEQVLINLCVNARDAMPEGGRLVIKTENCILTPEECTVFDWAKPVPYVVMSVSDTGSGMDKKTLDLIFEPFFTTKEQGKGTGLGLSTAYGIIRQHEGNILVESTINRGTIFTIYIPAVQSAKKINDTKSQELIVGGKETILIAEDEDQIRRLAKRILERAGYTVLEAANGEEAIKIFHEKKDKINILIMDVIMPKKGGEDVYNEVNNISPEIPCLFVSGYSETALNANFITERGLPLLQKPYQRESLLNTVRNVLDKKT